jgi:hypothetical protein
MLIDHLVRPTLHRHRRWIEPDEFEENEFFLLLFENKFFAPSERAKAIIYWNKIEIKYVVSHADHRFVKWRTHNTKVSPAQQSTEHALITGEWMRNNDLTTYFWNIIVFSM